jgi:hypothetical protein
MFYPPFVVGSRSDPSDRRAEEHQKWTIVGVVFSSGECHIPDTFAGTGRYRSHLVRPLSEFVIEYIASGEGVRSYEMMPAARKATIWLASRPIRARTSSVSAPGAGAARRTRVGVRENFAAGPVIGPRLPL